MKDWSDLTHRGRVRRLRRVAEAALEALGIQGRLRFIHHGENTTYRVDGRHRWLLRLCRPNYHSDASLHSEVVWLRHLRAAGLSVPDPVDGPDGPVVHIDVPGVPAPRRAMLFRWVPGRFAGASITARQFEAVGGVTARLHAAGDAFEPPPEFERPRADWAGLLGPEAIWGDPLAEPSLRGIERRVVAEAVERLRESFAGLSSAAPHWGLIHGDIHPWNVLFRGQRAALIDFDDTMFGPRMYDAMVTLWGWLDAPDFAEREAAWLAGYRAVRDLPAANFARWRGLIAVGRLRKLAWVRSRSDVPRIARMLPGTLARAVAAAREVTGDQPPQSPTAS